MQQIHWQLSGTYRDSLLINGPSDHRTISLLALSVVFNRPCSAQCSSGGLCPLSGGHFFIRGGSQGPGGSVRRSDCPQTSPLDLKWWAHFPWSRTEWWLMTGPSGVNGALASLQILQIGCLMKPATLALPAKLLSPSSAGSTTVEAVGRFVCLSRNFSDSPYLSCI